MCIVSFSDFQRLRNVCVFIIQAIKISTGKPKTEVKESLRHIKERRVFPY